MASEELLSGAVSYQIQDDLVGELRVDEALAWYRSDSYVNPDSDGPSFQVVDEAHIIQGSIVEPDARTVMGDAALVRADGGTVSVEASNSPRVCRSSLRIRVVTPLKMTPLRSCRLEQQTRLLV